MSETNHVHLKDATNMGLLPEEFDGICKILKEKVIILTTAGERQNEIDLERAKKALEKN